MKKVIIVVIIGIISLMFTIYFIGMNNKLIYSNTIYFGLGSIRLEIYDNGVVKEDKEIEHNHASNFKEIKKLTKEELDELKIKLDELDKIELERFVNKLVYGKESPGIMGF